MKTSYFFIYKGPGRLSIARSQPRFLKRAPSYKPLAPGPWFKKVDYPVYLRLYAEQLDKLDHKAVWEELHALAAARKREQRAQTREVRSEHMMNQFSKWIVACVMLMFFVGVALGAYAVLRLGADLGKVLDYIQALAAVAFAGYFLKAGFEKVALAPLQKAYGKISGKPDDADEGGI